MLDHVSIGPILDHVSISVADFATSRAFYDAVFATLGATALHVGDLYAGYGRDAPQFWVQASSHPVPADPRSGLHFSFTAPSRAAVDAFHATALAHGATDNGPPGPRPEYGPAYYAAFVIDPDGYRIEAHTEAA